jgi:predicted Ser/Thr protein kinase
VRDDLKLIIAQADDICSILVRMYALTAEDLKIDSFGVEGARGPAVSGEGVLAPVLSGVKIRNLYDIMPQWSDLVSQMNLFDEILSPYDSSDDRGWEHVRFANFLHSMSQLARYILSLEPEKDPYDILRTDCESKFYADGGFLGVGALASVYRACIRRETKGAKRRNKGTHVVDKDDCEYALRVRAADEQDVDTLRETIRIATWMGEEGIGPRVYDAWICKNVPPDTLEKKFGVHAVRRDKQRGVATSFLFMVMDRIDGWTLDLLALYSTRDKERDIFKKVKAVFRKMADLGVVHGDIGWQNIMITEDEKRAYLVDWDFAEDTGKPYKQTEFGLADRPYYVDAIFDDDNSA